MGATTSEVGYTSATTRRGDDEVYMDFGGKKGFPEMCPDNYVPAVGGVFVHGTVHRSIENIPD
jgi:hypothetical protein